jgi:monoamine oxidase
MRVAVVGAGFAGLACAVDLARAGVDVTVYEARDRVGGRVWSGVMPDGALYERGGEFIETGYDHMLRRAAEYDLALAPQGFEFAAREVRSAGQVFPTLLLVAERALAATVDALGEDAGSISAAEAIDRTSLEPLARLALMRRLEGTYTVELDRVSASWLASADVRAEGAAGALPSSRLAAGNDSLARAMARELGERIRLRCAVHALRNTSNGASFVSTGSAELSDGIVLAVPLEETLRAALPALGERSSYRRLQWGMASKLHVPLTAAAPPAAVQGLEAAFWTWTARAPAGGGATFASSFTGGVDAGARRGPLMGVEEWRDAIAALRPELALAPAGDAIVTNWRVEQWSRGSYSCHAPGWSRRDDDEIAAPYGHIHLAGEHTAGDFCGTMEGALRSGARAASEVLAEARRRG